jgi:hypothetical protein
VITSQGPWGPVDGGEGVRQFGGWLQGGERDYVMTLAEANKRKQAASSNADRLDLFRHSALSCIAVNLFRPVVQGQFSSSGAASLQNLTYHQSRPSLNIRSGVTWSLLPGGQFLAPVYGPLSLVTVICTAALCGPAPSYRTSRRLTLTLTRLHLQASLCAAFSI